MFSDTDLAQLRESTLTAEEAAREGWATETDAAIVAARLNRKAHDALAPALCIAYPGTDYVRYRPATALQRGDGSAAKYLSPVGSAGRVYVPHAAAELLTGQSRPVWITEGEKKAVAWTLRTHQPTLALPGVWNWADPSIEDKAARRRSLHPDLTAHLHTGRKIVIAFDGDVWENNKVADAAARLALVASHRDNGSHPVEIAVWDPARGKGLDDLLAADAADVVALRSADPAEWAESLVQPDLDELRRLAVWSAAVEGQRRKIGWRSLRPITPEGWQALGAPHGLSAAETRALASATPPAPVAATSARPWVTETTGLALEHVFSDNSRMPGGTTIPLDTGVMALARAYVGSDPDHPVAVRDGNLWRYERGRWTYLPLHHLSAWLQRQHGETAADGTLIALDERTLDRVHSCAIQYLDAPSHAFWAGRDHHWLACGDVSIRHDPAGIVEAAHDPAHGAVMGWDWVWRDSADCPTWHEAVSAWCSVAPGRAVDWADSAAKREAIEQWIGRSLLLGPHSVRRALLLTGDPGLGKSTALGAIADLWPSQGRGAVNPERWGEPYDRAALARTTCNVVNELPDQIGRRAVAAIKAIVECRSSVSARDPRGRAFDFVPSAAQLWAANDLPEWRDRTGAVWDRLVHIELVCRRYRGTDADREDLPTALRREQAAIVRHCVWRAHLALIAGERIPEPPSSAETRAAEQLAACSVAEWLEADVYTVSQTARLRTTEAYDAYVSWCGRAGRKQPVTAIKFGRRLKRLGVAHSRTAAARYYGLTNEQAI